MKDSDLFEVSNSKGKLILSFYVVGFSENLYCRFFYWGVSSTFFIGLKRAENRPLLLIFYDILGISLEFWLGRFKIILDFFDFFIFPKRK